MINKTSAKMKVSETEERNERLKQKTIEMVDRLYDLAEESDVDTERMVNMLLDSEVPNDFVVYLFWAFGRGGLNAQNSAAFGDQFVRELQLRLGQERFEQIGSSTEHDPEVSNRNYDDLATKFILTAIAMYEELEKTDGRLKQAA